MSKVCVVIPMYNHAEMTKRCVEMTLENAGMSVEIVVVDDGSTEPFVFNHNRVFVHRLLVNGGFTHATNQGILWCGDKYDYIHLLNNDTEPKPNFIKFLYDVMENDSLIGITSSARILNTTEDNKLELMGADLIRGYQHMGHEDMELPDIIHTHWVPLCSAMLRHKMVREIGLLDKHMRTWSSDNDYCFRANFADWNTTLVPKSRVYHIHQVTTGMATKEGISKDQQALLQKLAGLKYAELMKTIPLDCESTLYGKITFETYTK